MLAHFQLACWYHMGTHVEHDEARSREHLESALHGDKVKLDKLLVRAIEQTRERIGLPDVLDLDRPLGPAMPSTPGNVHRGQIDSPKLPPLRAKPARKLPSKPLAPTEVIYGLGVSPDGRQLLSGGVGGELLLWDIASRSVIRRCKNAGGSVVNSIRFSPAGTHALIGSEDSLWIRILDLEANDFIILKGHKHATAAVDWVATGTQLIAADHGGQLCLWDLVTRKVIAKQKGKGVWSLAVSPDGSRFAVGDNANVIRVHALPTLEAVASFPHHRHLIHGLAFDPEGKRLLSASRDGTVAVWDLEAGHLIRELRHGETVYAAQFTSPRHAVSGALDGRLVHWDLDTGASTELAKIASIHAVEVVGTLVIFGGEGGVRFHTLT